MSNFIKSDRGFMLNLDKTAQWFYYIYVYQKKKTNMKINIKGKELELHYSMRIHILYENIMNQSLSAVQGNTTSLVVLMYCAIMASIQKVRMNLTVSYDEFMDWLDEQKPDIFGEFSKWFAESVEVYSGVKLKKEEEKTSTEKADPND